MLSAISDLGRGRVDAAETTRMWTEKSSALTETWLRTNTALMRFAMTPFASTKTGLVDELASALTAPARRRVVSNARRLAKKRGGSR